MQKFFENHPLLREGLSGSLGGAGASESSPTFGSQFTDFGKGVWHTATDEPKSKDETAAKYSGLPLPVYRVAKGLVQQTYGYGQEAFDAFDWHKFWDTAKSKGGGIGGESLAKVLSESLKVDESSRKVGAEHLVHATAGLATMLVTALKGGAKTGEAAEAAGRAAKTGVETVKSVAGGPTRMVQTMAGTGTHLAEKVATGEVEKGVAAAEKHAGAVEKVTESNVAADTDYKTKVERINQDFDQKVTEAKQKHADDVAKRDKTVAELQGQHAEKVAAAKAEWVRKAYEAKQAGAQAAKLAARREALEHGQKAYTKLVDDNVKSTHKAVRGALDERWNALREKVGLDTPVKAPGLYNAVESARSMLAGVPADLKIFNDIVKEVTEKGEQVETESGELKNVPKESIPFDDARTQYSAIGEKAYGAEGNLRRALFTLYEAYDKALSETATAAGQGKEYGALKGDWKSYMQDWHDMRGQATGGSPLARLLKAVDDPIVAGQVLGKFGDRLIQTFARYDKYGASPTLMSKLRDMNAVTKALPKSMKVPNVPERLSPPPDPKLPPEVPSAEPVVGDINADRAKRLERTAQDRPEPKPSPIPPAPPTVSGMIEELKKAKLQKAKEFGEGHARARTYDMVAALEIFTNPISNHSLAYPFAYLGARVGWGLLANSEWMRTWLSRVTPADIKMLDEVYKRMPEEKAAAQQAIANGLIEKARKGEKLPPLNMFQSILNKAQLGAILRVVAPPMQQQQPNSAGAVAQP